jgi:hypothetical protein
MLLRALQDEAEAEKQYNVAETKRLTGKPVLYGAKIQLVNIMTRQYLRVIMATCSVKEYNVFDV